jgi:hypothetical protein
MSNRAMRSSKQDYCARLGWFVSRRADPEFDQRRQTNFQRAKAVKLSPDDAGFGLMGAPPRGH